MKNSLYLMPLIVYMLVNIYVLKFAPIYPAPPTPAKAAPIPPAVGSLWEIKTSDPFPSNGPAIKVLETKAGWVRYYVCPSMPDERCAVEVFLTIHRAAINNEVKVTP